MCFCRTFAQLYTDYNTSPRGNPSTRFITEVNALYTSLLRNSYITITLTKKEISKFIPKLSSVCKNEKVRVCYLIHQLSEKIDKGSRTKWIGAMLRNTGIEQDYYRSKYREPISDPPSKKKMEFAEALKEILG